MWDHFHAVCLETSERFHALKPQVEGLFQSLFFDFFFTLEGQLLRLRLRRVYYGNSTGEGNAAQRTLASDPRVSKRLVPGPVTIILRITHWYEWSDGKIRFFQAVKTPNG
jgi:hypothetical protein